MISASSVKARNLAANPKATLHWQVSEETGFDSLIIWGRGNVHDDVDDKKPAATKKTNKSGWTTVGNNGAKGCLLHGPNCGHSTEDCRTLQKQAKKMKGGHKPDGAGSSGKKCGNKTWDRKAAEAKASSSKEIATFIKKAIAKGVAKELNAAERKRKADDSSSDEEGELHCMDLKDFNYEDMENLKIDSEDDVSV